MQVFEALELREFPYFITVEVEEGETVRDVLSNLNAHKVYLLVDHDSKTIWAYNGPNSSFKLQVFGGILAGMMRKQLRLFYKVQSLNSFKPDDSRFQEILDKQIGPGRAKSIEKSDFIDSSGQLTIGDVFIHNPKVARAMDNIEQVPFPEEFNKIFVIISGILYSEEDTIETYLKKLKTSKKLRKLGRLNDGFTFFDDRNYSTRLIVKDRLIQGIELFVKQDDSTPSLKIKSPVIIEEKISREGNIETLNKAFQIPESLPDESLKTPDQTNEDKTP